MPSLATLHLYQHHRFSSQMISHAVWLSLPCSFSHRDVEAFLCDRGVIVSYTAICAWCHTGGSSCTPPWRRHPRPGNTWHIDKVCITINTVQEARARHCSRAQTRASCLPLLALSLP
jgi:putative transposase